MSFIQFYQSANLADPKLSEGCPWDFCPANREEMATVRKEERRKLMLRPDTAWNIYSAVRGVAASQRISKENAPAGLRGLVADYDMKSNLDVIVGYLQQLERKAPCFVPNFIETSLSGHARLVWIFEREVLVPDKRFCDGVIAGLFDLIGARTLLAGYDHKSEQCEMVWTNGGIWHEVNPTPMPWNTIFGLLTNVGKKTHTGHSEVPLEVIHAQVQAMFPNRWKGEFKLDSTGVRFWDDRADNQTGCQVKPDGMLCFTGRVPFMKWEQIFGAAWVNDQRSVNLGRIAGEIYFDDRHYWELKGGAWCPVTREDVLLNLTTQGISNTVQKAVGDTTSDAGRVLRHIQTVNRVTGAAPLINYRPGVVMLDGRRILNISTVRALDPSPSPATEKDFPWIWNFLNGLFDRPEDRPLDYFLAWLQRAYYGLHTYKRLMGQAVFLCGPKENGKSLLCYRIVKPMLGNKMANPYDYFIGATSFNDDLFESPLLGINDEEATTDEASRSRFLARIKSFCVNPSHAYHPKFCKKVTVEWTGRVFSTLNDDAASVGLLIEVNPNTRDKTMFFGSKPYTGNWDASHLIEERIEQELPFFARWLLDWQPPAFVLAPGRMGVKSYHDKRILALSRQQMPAYGLLEMLPEWIKISARWDNDSEATTINPTQLHQELKCIDGMDGPMHSWTGHKLFAALRTLANLADTGVRHVPNAGRTFEINRKLILAAATTLHETTNH